MVGRRRSWGLLEGSRGALEGLSEGSKTDFGGSRALVGPLGGVTARLGRAAGGVQDRSWSQMGPQELPDQRLSAHLGTFRPPNGPPGPPRTDPPDLQKLMTLTWILQFLHFPRGVDRKVEDQVSQSRPRGPIRDFDPSTLGARGPLTRGKAGGKPPPGKGEG